MPDKFTVALVQMSCGPEPADNLAKALDRVADAIAAYERASTLATQEPERRFLARRLAQLRCHPEERSDERSALI